MSTTNYRIPLRIVFYQQDETWVAHCLEFDLMGDGPRREDALTSLNDAIATQLSWSLEQNDIKRLFSPAPEEILEMFATGEDISAGEIAVSMMVPNTPHVQFEGTLLRNCRTTAQDRSMVTA